MATIGQSLKDARSKKSATLEDVHAKTKIHPRILQLLEEEKFDKLPSPLFAKSFLRSYAEFLELNADEIVTTYEKIGGAARNETANSLYIEPAHERNKPFKKVKKEYFVLPAALAVLVVIAVIGYDMFKTVSHWNAKQKKIAPSSHSSKFVAAKAASAAAQVAEKPVGDWLRSVELGNFPKLSKKDTLELQIKALDEVWMRVTCDGKVLYESILKRGALETWTASGRIELWTGNSSNMQLSLNKYPLGSPGKGVVKKMVINHDGVRIGQK